MPLSKANPILPQPFIGSSRRTDILSNLVSRAAELAPPRTVAEIASGGRTHTIDAKTHFDQPPKTAKELKETKEGKDSKEVKEHKEVKENKDNKENKEHKETKESKELKDNKEAKETKEFFKEEKEKEHGKESDKDAGKESDKEDDKDDEKEGEKEGKENKDSPEKLENIEKQGDKAPEKEGIEAAEFRPHNRSSTRSGHLRSRASKSLHQKPSTLLTRSPIV
jgi:hypothetical protein